MSNKHQGHFYQQRQVGEILLRVVSESCAEGAARGRKITCRSQIHGVAIGGHACDLRRGNCSRRTGAVLNHKLLAQLSRQIVRH